MGRKAESEAAVHDVRVFRDCLFGDFLYYLLF